MQIVDMEIILIHIVIGLIFVLLFYIGLKAIDYFTLRAECKRLEKTLRSMLEPEFAPFAKKHKKGGPVLIGSIANKSWKEVKQTKFSDKYTIVDGEFITAPHQVFFILKQGKCIYPKSNMN